MYPRTRPNHRWVNQWKTMYVVAATLVVLGVLMAITAADVHSPALGAFSLATLFVAFTGAMIASLIQSTWQIQQPIGGRVVDRFIEASGFTPLHQVGNDPINHSFEGDGTDLTHANTLYWLYVAPFNGSSLHRFLVDREVFFAHELGDEYDPTNPATRHHADREVLVRSVPAQQREERGQVEEQDGGEDRVN
jgi:hypothetical protein